jgi:hypothetical protein
MCAALRKGRAVGYVESEETRALTARKRLSLYVYSTTGKIIQLEEEPSPLVTPRQTIQEIAKQCGFQVIKGKVTTI